MINDTELVSLDQVRAERGDAPLVTTQEPMAPATEELSAVVDRLAQLALLEYDQVRKEEAKKLNVRPSILDAEVTKARGGENTESDDLDLFEPEPWREEMNGDDLLDQITSAIRSHVVMPEHAAEVVALWAVHCHAFEFWHHTPRLNVTAPEKGCGKSTLLDTIKPMVPRGIKTENMSTAVLFRVVDKHRPTLLIDECDSFLHDNEELRGCLNAGHAQGGRHFRCEGDNNDIRGIKTFAPAALAGIGNLPATLADRSIPIILHKRKPDEHVEDLRGDRTGHLRELASKMVRWVRDHKAELQAADPVMPEGVHNRQADNLRPLLAIADVAGGDWPERARIAAVAILRGVDDAESIKVLLLGDIRQIFDKLGADKLSSEQIVNRLHEREDQPWPEYGRQKKPISKNQVARLLKPFKINPGNIRDGEDVVRGYKLSQFKEAFARYLPSQTATTLQARDTAGFSPISNRYKETDVAVEKPLKARDLAGCSIVAVETPVNGGTDSFNDEQVVFEERAAILEFDGGLSRQEAEDGALPSQNVVTDKTGHDGDVSESWAGEL